MPMLVTAIISLLLTGGFTRLAISRGWGKGIRQEGPSSHLVKAGTPTMGGVAFLIAAVIGWLIFGGDRDGTAVLLLMLAIAVLGLADDVLALRATRSAGDTTGLLARYRLLFHGAIGLAFAIDATARGHMLTGVTLIDVVLYTLVIVGSVTAMNFADGLDGLCAGLMVIMLLAFMNLAFAPILLGALLGFLWYNVRPARVFMGGVGSESLGAGLAGLAIVSGTVWYLPLLALIPVLQVLSVIAQVTYFRMTGGKRLLRMSPLHHHFEQMGVSEIQITLRFWLITAATTGLVVWLIGRGGA